VDMQTGGNGAFVEQGRFDRKRYTKHLWRG
jgi:hypothetical protein